MILFASSRKEVIARWEKELLGFSSIFVSVNLDSLREKMERIRPQILFLDYDLLGLDGQKVIIELVKLNAETKIIAFIPVLPDEVEWGLYKAGVKGCCNNGLKSEQIKYAIEVVQRGELWIRRALTYYMLHELVVVTQDKDRIEQAVNDLLANLTRREYEIAMLVGQGESNKWIARQLTITERTVKAHLTEVFRKLNISDRLKLALIMKDTMTSLSQLHH